ncbi:hypothetical protein CDAR_33851 [Caerostris darwini]|uniref:Uncharacterized protein n=1 Tax=Caerostris darwini TaxID=1538125 RepID=A0AAV4WDK3_9ARAC|nr:hypothetical protein CDAR_33851 [Caerostris darwini]
MRTFSNVCMQKAPFAVDGNEASKNPSFSFPGTKAYGLFIPAPTPLRINPRIEGGEGGNCSMFWLHNAV